MPTYHIGAHVPILHHAADGSGRSHLHSIELSLYLSRPDETMLDFFEIERAIDRCLAPYRERLLNDLPEFSGGASIEQIGEVFFTHLAGAADACGLTLERFEIGETPLRTYIIRRAGPDEA